MKKDWWFTRSYASEIVRPISRASEFEQVSKTEHVAANPVRCFDIAVGSELYPKWAYDVKETDMLERDALSGHWAHFFI